MATKNLIKNFEEGTFPDAKDTTDSQSRETYAPSAPGITKKLAKEYVSAAQQPPSADGKATPLVRRISREDERMKPWTQAEVKRRVLIVLAHWERNSFNGALVDTAVAALTAKGHDVTVSDLYAQGFNPLPSRKDIQDGPRDPDHFNYSVEAGLAYSRGSEALAPDVAAEQAKLAKADVVIFQFPLNWCTVPAMLKGYFDRVLINKFAYDLGAGKLFDKGKFKERKAILSFTTGSVDSAYSSAGFMGDINLILWPLQNGIIRFCGWDVLSPNICFAPGRADDEERQAMLNAWKERLSKDLWKEQPIDFIPIEDFELTSGMLKGHKLTKLFSTSDDDEFDGGPGDETECRTDSGRSSRRLPIGQHSGLPLTAGSMYRPSEVTISSSVDNGQ